MENNIRNWIASGLLSGYTMEEMKPLLIKCGFSGEEIEQELVLAGPYISATSTIQKKLMRREGLLKMLDQLLRQTPGYLHLEKTRLPPYETFLKEYYYPNQCGWFSSVLDNCEAKSWTPQNLINKVGTETLIEIQLGRESHNTAEHSSTRYGHKIKFGEYIRMIEKTEPTNHFYMAGGNYDFNRTPFEVLRKDITDLGDGGYLNQETPTRKMHFMFGPKGAVTPIHYDNVSVLLVQVYGRKLVRCIPAMQVPYLYNNKYPRNSDLDFLDYRSELYPDFANATVVEAELGPGDCLFIPLGWWHHVTCLSTNISVVCCNIKADETITRLLM